MNDCTRITNFWVSPNGTVFYRSRSNDLYRSFDSGLNWENINPSQFTVYEDYDLYFDKAGNIFHGSGSEMFMSANNGTDWEKISDIPADATEDMAFALNSEIFITTNSLWTGQELYRSTDGGQTWETDFIDFNAAFNMHVTSKGHIYFVANGQESGIYVTYDNFETYQLVYPSEIAHSFVSSLDGQVFAMVDTGIVSTKNDGLTWEVEGIGLPELGTPNLLHIDHQQYLYVAVNGDIIYKSAEPTAAVNFALGKVWYDENGNCQKDPDELELSGWKVQANRILDYLSVTNNNGDYFMPLTNGNYTFAPTTPNQLWAPACPNNLPITLTGGPDTANVDLPVMAVETCAALSVDISTTLLRRCFANKYYVRYCNEGTATAQDVTITVNLDSYFDFNSATAPILSQNGQQFTFDIGEMGINDCGSFQILGTLNCSAALGQEHCVEASILPDDCTLLPNLPARECRENIGSFDPNDKMAFIENHQAGEWILPDTDIEYLIRFQNTGTDTAFNIKIEDRLSFFLDPATLKPGASSHPYRWELEENNLLRFYFDEIMLPDSNINETASHGFVKFKISQKPQVPWGNKIINSADIYFDFNEAVKTNKVVLEVGEPVPVIEPHIEPKDMQVNVFPNPFSNFTNIKIAGAKGNKFKYQLFNPIGNLVSKGEFNGNQFQLEKNWIKYGCLLFDGKI